LVDRALFRLESLLALVGGAMILALMLLAVFQILGRKFFDMPVLGFIDLVEQAMAVFAFLGIAYCQRLGGHIRMDIVVGILKRRPLWLMEILSSLFMLFLTVVLTIGSWLHFKRAFDIGDSSIDIGLPLWPAKLLVPLALSLLALRLVLQLWGYARAFVENADRPVAVPLVESAAEQAQHEAEALHGVDGDDEEEVKPNGTP
jgi:TRAP-type C4-dicarboxylate transport system permease small subunit